MCIRHGVVSARDAKKNVVGHIVNGQGFEMFGALKSNCSLGRAMPELVERCALGMAAMGAGRVGKRVEDGKLLFRKTAKGKYEEQPRMQFSGHGFGNSAHDPRVELANVSHISASTGTELRAHMGTCKVHQRLRHLKRACKKIKLKLIRIEDGPVGVHTHAVVKQLLQEQPDGPSGGCNSGLPRLVGSIAWGGRR